MDLTGKSKEEIIEIYTKVVKRKPHHNAKLETLIYQINQQSNAAFADVGLKDPLKHIAETGEVAQGHTQEQVLSVIQPFIDRTYKDGIGFQVKFLPDNTWHFKCMGAEDTGHMSVALRKIREKAEIVSRGAKKPLAMGRDHVNGTYGDVVLMG